MHPKFPSPNIRMYVLTRIFIKVIPIYILILFRRIIFRLKWFSFFSSVNIFTKKKKIYNILENNIYLKCLGE